MKTSEILIIVVVYNCKLEYSESLRSLSRSIELNAKGSVDCVVYDNSSQKQDYIPTFPSIDILHYEHDQSNGGVSRAYNFGADVARKLGKGWLLLVDQDTSFPEMAFGTIDSFVCERNGFLYAPVLMSANSSVVFSPSRLILKRGFPVKVPPEGLISLRKYSPINSGLVISLELFLKVGGYNEEIKLDFSDFEFIDRVKNETDILFVLPFVAFHDLSSAGKSSLSSACFRYSSYCTGALEYSKGKLRDILILGFVCFARQAILCFRYRTFVFIGIFLKKYLGDAINR